VLLHNVLKKVISFTKERLEDVNVLAVAEVRHLTVINQPVKAIKVDPMDDFYMFIPEDVFAKEIDRLYSSTTSPRSYSQRYCF